MIDKDRVRDRIVWVCVLWVSERESKREEKERERESVY